ncbi:hypothetical protein BKA67DRAFT_659359 [Truncatella angustata]|uniref:Uncharacterized protein n=1 Tax=Truncatella angustata TaxID=152316 RepID=A0A9P8UIC6_9PEZI|nr:uncharacterized protein BKA67DRAFT_659359 [Truncatella angustata]KAH6652671.1 hypothetical protein BKA67DRAFT_659359 [Truncatella angustata]
MASNSQEPATELESRLVQLSSLLQEEIAKSSHLSLEFEKMKIKLQLQEKEQKALQEKATDARAAGWELERVKDRFAEASDTVDFLVARNETLTDESILLKYEIRGLKKKLRQSDEKGEMLEERMETMKEGLEAMINKYEGKAAEPDKDMITSMREWSSGF